MALSLVIQLLSVGVWIRVRVPQSQVSVQSRPCLGRNLIDKREAAKTKRTSSERHDGTSPWRILWGHSAMAGAFHILHAREREKKNRLSSMLARCSRFPLPVLGQPISAPAQCPGGVWAIRIDSKPLNPR